MPAPVLVSGDAILKPCSTVQPSPPLLEFSHQFETLYYPNLSFHSSFTDSKDNHVIPVLGIGNLFLGTNIRSSKRHGANIASVGSFFSKWRKYQLGLRL
ncbi:hypothetical protein ACH5RR_029982 [Cinchona calisaya]|uniref:Uncharacterized protein n=1 Tax=Cinchona calisaya TaxID=153742 RepID=A0ABD2YVI3_9GENT